eukprot:tig00021221_g19348.t1
MGSLYEAKLAQDIVKDFFGDIVEKVAAVLLHRGKLSLQDVMRYSGLQYTQTRNSLLILLQHSIASAVIDGDAAAAVKPGAPAPAPVYQYHIAADNILHRLRFPRFAAHVKLRFGQRSEAIIDELVQHGRLGVDQLTQQAERALTQSLLTLDEPLEPGDEREALRDCFVELVRHRYIERVPPLGLPVSPAPVPSEDPQYSAVSSYLSNRFILPPSIAAMLAERSKKQSAAANAAAAVERAAASGRSAVAPVPPTPPSAGGAAARKRKKGADAGTPMSPEGAAGGAGRAASPSAGPPSLPAGPRAPPPPPPFPPPTSETGALLCLPPGSLRPAAAEAAAGQGCAGRAGGRGPGDSAAAPGPSSGGPGAPAGSTPEGEILWRVNYDQIVRVFRHEAVVRLVSEKYNPTAAAIVRSVLLVTAPFEKTRCDPTTCVFYVDQVHPSLPIDLNVNKNKLGDYMELLCKDTTGIATKHGETGGGAYTLNLRAALDLVKRKTVEAIVSERFGEMPARVFRLLLAKTQLEEKQVGELAMIPLYRACFNVRRRLLAEVARRDQLLRGSGNGANGNGAVAAVGGAAGGAAAGAGEEEGGSAAAAGASSRGGEAGGGAKAGAGDKEKAGAAGADGERTVAEMQQQALKACDRLENTLMALDESLCLFSLF